MSYKLTPAIAAARTSNYNVALRVQKYNMVVENRTN